MYLKIYLTNFIILIIIMLYGAYEIETSNSQLRWYLLTACVVEMALVSLWIIWFRM